MVIFPGHTEDYRQMFSNHESASLSEHNALVSYIKELFLIARLGVDILKGEAWSHQNMTRFNGGIYGRLEWKYYQCKNVMLWVVTRNVMSSNYIHAKTKLDGD